MLIIQKKKKLANWFFDNLTQPAQGQSSETDHFPSYKLINLLSKM